MKRVALAFPTSEAHLHGVTRGVVDYARAHGGWVLTTGMEAPTLPIGRLAGWRGDGVIATITNSAEAKAARKIAAAGVPVVTFSGALKDPGVPRVRVDNAWIGELAAEHLLGCGYRRFGYYGLRGMTYAQDRGSAFRRRVESAGGTWQQQWASPALATGGTHELWQDEIEALGEWLVKLGPPVGIYAANDYRARMVLDACERRGLKVPEEVGVIGTDNNLVVCDFSAPTLSSVDCNWYRVGTVAAALLERLMNGAEAPRRDVVVAPESVHRRASTDVMIAANSHVARAIGYVRQHIGEVFGVERLVEAAGISRRVLEEAFQEELGRSPYRQLCTMRVEQAKRLLAGERRMKLGEVAARCGFADLRRFRLVFERVEGVAAREWRVSNARRNQ